MSFFFPFHLDGSKYLPTFSLFLWHAFFSLFLRVGARLYFYCIFKNFGFVSSELEHSFCFVRVSHFFFLLGCWWWLGWFVLIAVFFSSEWRIDIHSFAFITNSFLVFFSVEMSSFFRVYMCIYVCVCGGELDFILYWRSNVAPLFTRLELCTLLLCLPVSRSFFLFFLLVLFFAFRATLSVSRALSLPASGDGALASLLFASAPPPVSCGLSRLMCTVTQRARGREGGRGSCRRVQLREREKKGEKLPSQFQRKKKRN